MIFAASCPSPNNPSMSESAKISHPKKAAFLAAYAQCGNVSQSADAADIDRHTHYEWLASDAGYATAFAQAQERATEALERVARERATIGTVRKKFTQRGEPILDPETGKQYVEHEVSDTLLIFLLKGLRPDKYRENLHHTGDGTAGGNTLAIHFHNDADPAKPDGAKPGS
jgi:hypothetical protein